MRNAANNYAGSTLATALGAAGATVTVNDGSVFPADDPFYVVADILSPTNREVMYITSRNGNDLTIGARYLQGSAAPSNISHSPGVSLDNRVLGQYLADIWDAITEAAAGFAEGTLANRPAANGSQGVYRTTDGNGTYIDIASVWYRLVTDEGGAVAAGSRLRLLTDAGTPFIFGGSQVSGRGVLVLEEDGGRNGVAVYNQADASAPDQVRLNAGGATRLTATGVGVTLAGDVSGGNLLGVFDKVDYNAVAVGTGTLALNWTQYAAAYRVATNGASITVSMTWPTVSTAQMYTTQFSLVTGATLPSITWPADVRWTDGVAPTLEASRAHQFVFQRLVVNGQTLTWGTLAGVRVI